MLDRYAFLLSAAIALVGLSLMADEAMEKYRADVRLIEAMK